MNAGYAAYRHQMMDDLFRYANENESAWALFRTGEDGTKGTHLEKLGRICHRVMPGWRPLIDNLCRSVTIARSASLSSAVRPYRPRPSADATSPRMALGLPREAPDAPSGMPRGHVLPPPVEAPSFLMIAAKPATTTLAQAIKLTVASLPSRFIVVDRQARKAPGRA